MKVASWNVNSLRAREGHVIAWLKREQPDVLCMQETKVVDDEFPTEAFQRLGYGVMMAGEKSYNGVAIASRKLIRNVRVGLEGAPPDAERRLIAAKVGKLQLINCYVPNGQSLESAQFEHKLQWLDRLKDSLSAWTDPERDVLVCGDFNIAADERDLFDPEAFRGQTHFHPLEHQRLAALKQWGLVDLFRSRHDGAGLYSWWDYRGGAFRKNEGLRIDYIFTTPGLARRCREVYIDSDERGREKPSDHAPVVAVFDD